MTSYFTLRHHFARKVRVTPPTFCAATTTLLPPPQKQQQQKRMNNNNNRNAWTTTTTIRTYIETTTANNKTNNQFIHHSVSHHFSLTCNCNQSKLIISVRSRYVCSRCVLSFPLSSVRRPFANEITQTQKSTQTRTLTSCDFFSRLWFLLFSYFDVCVTKIKLSSVKTKIN